jgi:hypothetical protein
MVFETQTMGQWNKKSITFLKNSHQNLTIQNFSYICIIIKTSAMIVSAIRLRF